MEESKEVDFPTNLENQFKSNQFVDHLCHCPEPELDDKFKCKVCGSLRKDLFKTKKKVKRK